MRVVVGVVDVGGVIIVAVDVVAVVVIVVVIEIVAITIGVTIAVIGKLRPDKQTRRRTRVLIHFSCFIKLIETSGSS